MARFNIPRRAWLPAGVALWIVAAAVGLKVLLDYQGAAGIPGRPPRSWPASVALQAPADRPMLLVFAHPHCPCTRATIEELAHIMLRTKGRLHATVLFVIPPGKGTRWAETDIWSAASAIPGVEVRLDRDGEIARRFGSSTSGQTLLYGPDGRLVFAGGITPGRGHAGDSAGRDAIVASVATHETPCASTPVYGCALLSSPPR